jgi:hypothetical protein
MSGLVASSLVAFFRLFLIFLAMVFSPLWILIPVPYNLQIPASAIAGSARFLCHIRLPYVGFRPRTAIPTNVSGASRGERGAAVDYRAGPRAMRGLVDSSFLAFFRLLLFFAILFSPKKSPQLGVASLYANGMPMSRALEEMREPSKLLRFLHFRDGKGPSTKPGRALNKSTNVEFVSTDAEPNRGSASR